MALSIEQQRKYARMLTPDQLANYVKNEDLGNEIGITPVVFAEAIAEINAEDKELQPVAPNTVMDREVTEMLGRGGQGLEGLMPQEPMNPGMMPQQFSHGGMIPGYQNGGEAQGYSDIPAYVKAPLTPLSWLGEAMPKTERSPTPSWMQEIPVIGGMFDDEISPMEQALLEMYTGRQMDPAALEEGMIGFEGGPATKKDLARAAFNQWLLAGGLGGSGIVGGTLQATGNIGSKVLRPAARFLDPRRFGTQALTKSGGWRQKLMESIRGGKLDPHGKWVRELLDSYGKKPPSIPRYRTSNKGVELTMMDYAQRAAGAMGLGGILGLGAYGMRGDGSELEGGSELGDIRLGPIAASPPPGRGGTKKDDIAGGNEVSAEQEIRNALGLGDLPVDVPAGGSGIDQMISSIQKQINAGANKEEEDLLTALQGRTAIPDRISELKGSREEDYEQYLQDRFYNALGSIAQPGGIPASLSASDSGYRQSQDDLEKILADLKMQGEGQNIETARVAADLSRIGEQHLPSLFDAQLAKWQEAMATARSRDEQEFAVKELALQLAAGQPTALEGRIKLMEVYSDIMQNASMMGLSPAALDTTRRTLESLIMGGAEVTAEQEG